MSLILHLTDLHLGDRGGNIPLGDYKTDFVPGPERVTRHKLLVSTLSALANNLRESGEILDALVISGDITYGHALDGFEELDTTLRTLGDRLPPPNRIVVVPGNHDVKWGTEPSSHDRYADFLTYIRDRGYVTPFLDGVDSPMSSAARPDQHQLLLDSGMVQIVPLNSANYCGVIEPLTVLREDQLKEVYSRISAKDKDALTAQLDLLRSYDAARLSPEQLTAVGALIQSGSVAATKPTTRIAVLHHHLLPVNTAEEVKPFDAIVNLGAVREFFLSNEFDVVIHGHKHVGGVFWDTLSSPSSQDSSRRILVISGSTIGGAESRRSEVCRLIRVDSGTTAPQIALYRVPAVDAGGRLSLPAPMSFPLWDRMGACQRRTDSVKTLSGPTLDAVYDQLLAYFQNRTERDATNGLICEIENAPVSGTLPANYPEIPGRKGAEREEWLQQLVRWWQRPSTALDNPRSFTHGERIYRFDGEEHDQLKQAADALQRKLETSRAIISLVGPGTDDWSTDIDGPSFCSVQFLVIERSKTQRLNCVAYFRKQEMRYWWPVNVAELVHLQSEVLEKLRPRHPEVQPGSITTFSAIAVARNSVPKVAVPIIDRLLDEDASMVWQLAYALVWPGYPERERIVGKWNELLGNLMPPTRCDPDGEPIAVRGLQELMKDIDRFRRLHPTGPIQKVYDALDTLLQTNKAYLLETRAGAEQSRHNAWRANCERILERLKMAVEECWKAA